MGRIADAGCGPYHQRRSDMDVPVLHGVGDGGWLANDAQRNVDRRRADECDCDCSMGGILLCSGKKSRQGINKNRDPVIS